MNKKAVTPLISTLILIVFAAALGAVVISWGNSEKFVVPEAGCEDVDLSLVKINDVAQICYSNGFVEFTAQNQGDAVIDGFKLVVIGAEDITRAEIETNLITADVVKQRVDVADVGAVQKILLIPKVSGKLCSKNSFGADNVGECE